MLIAIWPIIAFVRKHLFTELDISLLPLGSIENISQAQLVTAQALSPRHAATAQLGPQAAHFSPGRSLLLIPWCKCFMTGIERLSH